jgi:hypothetical protein
MEAGQRVTADPTYLPRRYGRIRDTLLCFFLSLVDLDLVETRSCQASINNATVRRLDGSTNQDYAVLVLLYKFMPSQRMAFLHSNPELPRMYCNVMPSQLICFELYTCRQILQFPVVHPGTKSEKAR